MPLSFYLWANIIGISLWRVSYNASISLSVTFLLYNRFSKKNTMKKILLPFLTVLLSLSNCYSQPEIKTLVNDVNAEKRNVTAFKGVEVSNAISLYLSQGNEDAVAVSCSDASDNKKIKTEVKNGVLKISMDYGSWGWNNKKVKAYVSIKNIEILTISGASNCKINEGIITANLKLKVSGASSVKGNIKATNINIDASGASNINLLGSANEAIIEASGASSIKGFEFETSNCTVDASGASNINIGVTTKLKAEASGASTVKYKGSATIVESNATGASSIKKY